MRPPTKYLNTPFVHLTSLKLCVRKICTKQSYSVRNICSKQDILFRMCDVTERSIFLAEVEQQLQHRLDSLICEVKSFK